MTQRSIFIHQKLVIFLGKIVLLLGTHETDSHIDNITISELYQKDLYL